MKRQSEEAEKKWQPLLRQCFSPDGLLPCSVSTGRFLLLVASMGQVWRTWRLFCSGTSFRCVFSLQSSCCILLPQAFASPKWLFADIAVSLLSCLFRVLPGHSLKIANSRVLLALSSASPLWSPWACPLDYQFKFLLCFLLVFFLHSSHGQMVILKSVF